MLRKWSEGWLRSMQLVRGRIILIGEKKMMGKMAKEA